MNTSVPNQASVHHCLFEAPIDSKHQLTNPVLLYSKHKSQIQLYLYNNSWHYTNHVLNTLCSLEPSWICSWLEGGHQLPIGQTIWWPTMITIRPADFCSWFRIFHTLSHIYKSAFGVLCTFISWDIRPRLLDYKSLHYSTIMRASHIFTYNDTLYSCSAIHWYYAGVASISRSAQSWYRSKTGHFDTFLISMQPIYNLALPKLHQWCFFITSYLDM